MIHVSWVNIIYCQINSQLFIYERIFIIKFTDTYIHLQNANHEYNSFIYIGIDQQITRIMLLHMDHEGGRDLLFKWNHQREIARDQIVDH
jgi:hypothetical protein